jgi:Tfp pilus assembly protein PilN
MRPVNLIPPEDRRGDRAPTRTGPVAYIVVGALALALAGITAVVLTNNQVSDRKAEVAELEAREAAARETADELAPYAEFAAMHEARLQTVANLAQSRFDWERVLRELALVIPPDVELTAVTGTVSSDVTLSGGGGNSLRESTAGPALEIKGCAPSHTVVAELAAALEDIDGVTRVGVNGSAKSSDESDGDTGGSSTIEGCTSSKPTAGFEMLAAFDAVAVPAAAGTAPESPAPATGADESQVADATQQKDQARESVEKGTEDARETADNLVPGTIR